MIEDGQGSTLLDIRLRWDRRKLWFTRTIFRTLFVALVSTGSTRAQSQSVAQPAAQSQASKPQSGRAAGGVAEAARETPTKQSNSEPHKVYTNDDLTALPPGDVSLVGPRTAAPSAATPQPKAPTPSTSTKPAANTKKAAAYWKARFTAARQKLAQDQKALPVLQSALETERVQQTLVDEDTGQVYSDAFMNLLHQIDATKLAIQKDQKALSDLRDEFRHAGGLPGWIR